jgi:NAD(P)-dependent dehydrogenase (short-subunit alcohol dehydrogenase family)
MDKKLDGCVVIITGAASGLGEASSRLFAEHGARLVMADINAERGHAIAQEIGARFVETDVSQSAAVDRLVSDTVEREGQLDVMFNNAGVATPSDLLVDTDDKTFNLVSQVNFAGMFYGIRAAGRIMREQRRGVIISTASTGGIVVSRGITAYCATKAAVIALTKGCALELAPFGVRVNALCPGAMFTGMTAGISEEQRRWINNISPMGWAAQPIEMAKGALYLASDDAAYVSGHELVVDGASIAGFRYQ